MVRNQPLAGYLILSDLSKINSYKWRETMSKHKNLKPEDCSAEELLKELEKRQCESVSEPLAKNNRPLAQYDSKTLHKALIRAQKLVYGVDDRQDIYQISDDRILKLADSVVSLIDVGRMSDNGDGTSRILTVPFEVSNNLCAHERFRKQPTAPFCSGFLVAPGIIATAGHCVDGNNLARVRFVFGFRMIDETEGRVVIPNSQIFRGAGIISRKLEQVTGSDYALIRLGPPGNWAPITGYPSFRKHQ